MKNSIVFIVALSLIAGCSKNVPATRSPTQDLLNTFPQIEEVEPAPLEVVQVPPREEPPAGSSFFRLRLGETAPLDGFLFSDVAAAFMVSEYEAISQRYELALSSQRLRDFERLKLETGSLRLQINADRERFQLILKSFDLRIQDLQNIIEDQNSPFRNIWTIIGVGSVGIIVGFAAGLIIN